MADLRLFSRDFISEFIELYKSFPCLWQVSSKEYSDRVKRKAAYDRLVSKYREVDRKATKDEMKKKLYGLRSSYRRELTKLKKSIASSATIDEVYKPNLWYFYLFDFLNDNGMEKEPTSTTGEYLEGEDQNDPEYAGEDVNDGDEDDDSSEGSDNTEAIDPFGKDSLALFSPAPRQQHCQSSATTPSHSRTTSAKKPKLECPEYQKNQRELAESSEEYLQSVAQPSEDQFDVFGKLVAHKLRSFDKLQVIYSQRLINGILYEGEMGFLTGNCKVVDMGSS